MKQTIKIKYSKEEREIAEKFRTAFINRCTNDCDNCPFFHYCEDLEHTLKAIIDKGEIEQIRKQPLFLRPSGRFSF